ncbi:MAG: transposase [Candidatus Thermoplasmatota archaeon]|nr:transposase [Candidatus Thermoplasmatota archaeon]
MAGTRADVLFPKKPTLHFIPQEQDCPVCRSCLHIEKTWTKDLITMDIGAFRAKETVMMCPQGHGSFVSTQLRNLAPVNGTFGFDVIVKVGYSLFVHCRNNQEVLAELAAKNVFMSEREVSYLGRKFIVYLAIAHRQSHSRLRNFMSTNGGYILHLDGTCEGDSPNLFCGLDGISELVLDSVKIPSEKKDKLVPFFRGIKKKYGVPIALVHDMGKGIITAVEEVFPGVADFICHFHFLRDIGKDLLLDDYTALLKRLRKLKARPLLRQRVKYLEQKINPDDQVFDEIMTSIDSGVWQASSFEHFPLITVYVLLNWIFAYSSQSKAYGFPFDRQHFDFYRRLQKIYQLLSQIIDAHLDNTIKAHKPVFQVHKKLKEIAEDKRLNDLADSLERKAEVFDKLREAMRIAPPEGKSGLNDDGNEIDMKNIEENVTEFRKWLVGQKRRRATYFGMIKQLDKYWDKLFADPLPVAMPDGILHIYPQRTNNLLERFFRGVKQRGRKKSGLSSLSKVLKSALADTPLVQNLNNSKYLEIILNGCSNLEERFSQIDVHLVQDEMEKAKNNSEKILPAVKKLMKDSDLTKKISAMFASVSKTNANCHLRL